ncbi:MAG: CD225/dispanin family protein [Tepidisphaeraceae bacterium]
MFCQTCGNEVDPHVRFCPRCGTATAPAVAPPRPPVPQPGYAQPVQYATPPQFAQPRVQAYPPGSVPNYMVQAIIVTLICCMPIGIVAIVKASQVNSKLSVGDWQGAMNSSASARTWCWVSFWCSLVAGILWLGVMFAGGVA